MIELITKSLIKKKGIDNEIEVRSLYGTVCGAIGIFLNLLLAGMKILVGTISGSIAVTADGINNLSDAGSSIITLLGFKMASQKPDKDHPFGHGRFEYLAGMIVALLIVLVGYELGKSSVEKIIHPEKVIFSWVTVIALILSIIIKFIMAGYNRKYGKRFDSETLMAVSQDSLNDTISSFAVLVTTILLKFFDFSFDPYVGLAVAAFILYSGYNALKDTVDPLLGKAPSKEFVNDIEEIVMSHPEILGIHDLIVHDYGPGRVMISLHGEVDSKGDILELHDVIDNIESELREKLLCEAVIHMDPLVVDEKTTMLKEKVKTAVKGISEELNFHDFRMVAGPTHTNLIFDVLVPYGFKMSDEEIKKQLSKEIENWGNYFAVILIDKDYVGIN